MKEKSVNDNKNTTTPTLPTTPYYINSWGYFNKEKEILEKIGLNLSEIVEEEHLGEVKTEVIASEQTKELLEEFE